MKYQKDYEKFYQDLIEGVVENEYEHIFLKNNNIYFHATPMENYDNIIKLGFLKKLSPRYLNFFGKSFFICRNFVENKNYVVFAVDLDELLSDPKNINMYEKEDSIIKIALDVEKEFIVGVLKFNDNLLV